MSKKFGKRVQRNRGKINVVESVDPVAIVEAVKEVEKLESMFVKANRQVMNFDKGVYGVNTKLADFSDTLKEMDKLDTFDIKDLKEYTKYVNSLRTEIEDSRTRLLDLNTSKNKIAENYYVKYMGYLKDIRKAEMDGTVASKASIEATRAKMKVLKQEHNETLEAINKKITNTNNIVKQSEATMKTVKTTSHGIFSPAHMGLNKATTGLKSFTSTLSKIGATYATLQAGMYMYKLALGRSIEKFEELEDKVFELGVVSGKTTSQIKALRVELLDQASTSRYSAGEISDSLTSVIRTGKEYDEAMKIVASSTDLATASFADLGYATETVNKTMVSFGMEAENAGKVVNAFHNIVLSTPLDLEQLNDSLRQSASGFGAIINFSTQSGESLERYKVSVMETMSVMTGLQALMGRSGSQAGTTLKMFSSKLLALTPAAKKQFNEQMKASGEDFSANKLSNLVKSDLDGAINKLSELYTAGTLSYEVLMKMFGTRHVSQISNSLSMIGGDLQGTKDQFLRLRDVTQDSEQAQESWSNSIKELRNSMTGLEGSFVSFLDGPAKDLMDFLSFTTRGMASMDSSLGGIPSTLAGITASMGPIALIMNKFSEFAISKAMTKDAYNVGGLVQLTGVLEKAGDFMGANKNIQKSLFLESKKRAKALLKLKKDGVALDATQLAMYNALINKEAGYHKLISKRSKIMSSLTSAVTSPVFLITAALVAGTTAFYAYKKHVKELEDQLKETRKEMTNINKKSDMYEKKIVSGSQQILNALSSQTESWYDLSDGIMFASKSLGEFFSTDVGLINANSIARFDNTPMDNEEFRKYIYGDKESGKTGFMDSTDITLNPTRINSIANRELENLKNLGDGFSEDSFSTIEEFVKGRRDNIEVTMDEYKNLFGEDLRGKSSQEVAGLGGRRLTEEGNILIDGFRQLNEVVSPLRDKIEITSSIRNDEANALMATVESVSRFESSIKSFANELKDQEKTLLKAKMSDAKTYGDFTASISNSRDKKAFRDIGLIGDEKSELMFYRKDRIKKYGDSGFADVEAAGSLLDGIRDSDRALIPQQILGMFDKQGSINKGVNISDINNILSSSDLSGIRDNIKNELSNIRIDKDISSKIDERAKLEKNRMVASGESSDLSESELTFESKRKATDWAVEKYGSDNKTMVDELIRKAQLTQMEILLKALDVAGQNISAVFEDRLVQFNKAISTVGMKDLENEIRRADFFGDTKTYYAKVEELNDMKYENQLQEIRLANEKIVREAKVSYGGIAEKSKEINDLSIDTIGDMTVTQLEDILKTIESESVVGSDGTSRIKEGYQKLYVDIGNMILNKERKIAVEAIRKTDSDIKNSKTFIRNTSADRKILGFNDIYGDDSSKRANKTRSSFMNLQIANKGVLRDSSKNEMGMSRAISMINSNDTGTKEGLDALATQMFGVDSFGDLSTDVQDALQKLVVSLNDSSEQINKSIVNMAEGMYNFTTGLYKSLRGEKGLAFSGATASKDMFSGIEAMLNNKQGSKKFNTGLQDAMVNMSLLVADFSNLKFADMIEEQRDNLKDEENLLNRQIKLADTERDRVVAQTKLANAQASAMLKIAGVEGKQVASQNMLGMLKQGYEGYKWLNSEDGAAAIGKVKGWFGGGDTATGATTGTTGGTTAQAGSTALGTAGAVAGGVGGGVGMGMALNDGFQMEDTPALAMGGYAAYSGGTALASGAGMGAMAGIAAAGALAGVGIVVGMAVMDQMGKAAVADAAKKANKELKEYESKQYEEQMIDILKEQSGILKGIKDNGISVGFGEAFGRQLQQTQLSATSTELFKSKYIDGGWFGSGTWAREAVSATVTSADFGIKTAKNIEDVYTLMGSTFSRIEELQGLKGSRGKDSGSKSQRRQWAMWQAEQEATQMLFDELRGLQKSYVTSLDDLYTQYFGFETVALNRRGEIAKEGEVVAEYQTSFWKDREKVLKAVSDDFINGASSVGKTIASSFVGGITSAISKNDLGLSKALSGLEDSFLNLSKTYIDSDSLVRAADFELGAGKKADVGMLKNILGQFEGAGYGTEELFKSGYAEANKQAPDIQNLYDIIKEISGITGSRDNEIKDLVDSLSKVETESDRLEKTMEQMTEEWVNMGGKLSDLTSALNNRLKGLVDITGGALGKDSGAAIGELKGFFESYLLPQVKDSMVDSVQGIILDINKTTSVAIEKVMSGDMNASEITSMIGEISSLTDMLSDPEMYENELRKLGIQDDQVDTMIQYLKLQEAISDAVFERMTFDGQISKIQKDITDQAGKYKKIMNKTNASDSGLAGRQSKTLDKLNEYINKLEDTKKLSKQATKDFTEQWASGSIDGLFESIESELHEVSKSLFNSMKSAFSSKDSAKLGTSIGSSLIKGITDSYSSNLMNNKFKSLFADINTVAFKALDQIDDGFLSMDTIHSLSQQVQSASVKMEGERQKVEAALSMFDYGKEITYDKLEKEISYSTSSTKESVYNISNYNTFEVGNLVSTSADLEYFAQIFAPYMQQAFRDIGVGTK